MTTTPSTHTPANAPAPDDAWTDALTSFEAHLTRRALALSTVEGYLRDLEHLRDGTRTDPWTLPTRTLRSWLEDQNWSRRTHLRVLVTLRAFYRFGIDTGVCDRSPLIGLQTVTLKKSGPARQRPTPLWREPIEGFQRHLAAGGRSPATVDMYGIRLQLLSYTLADPWAVTATDVSDYLSRPDWSPSTRRGNQNTIRRFYRWARKHGHTDTDPADDLEPVRMPRQLPRPAADDALADALSRADDRTRLALELGALAGLRIGESARLRWDQVGPDALLVQGKGGHWRRVPLHPQLAGALTAARARADRDAHGAVPSPYVFPSTKGGHLTPGHLGKLITDAAGPGTFTAHGLRHRFATQAYAATLDLRAVQELLGHTKPETTAVYAAVPDGALSAAVAGARTGIARAVQVPSAPASAT